MRIMKALTRGDFLKGTAGIALASAFGPGLPSTAQAQTKSTVILIRDAQVHARSRRIHARQ
jgi:spermidine/putrescine-binding protein